MNADSSLMHAIYTVKRQMIPKKHYYIQSWFWVQANETHASDRHLLNTKMTTILQKLSMV